jgi:hypothetical protein
MGKGGGSGWVDGWMGGWVDGCFTGEQLFAQGIPIRESFFFFIQISGEQMLHSISVFAVAWKALR